MSEGLNELSRRYSFVPPGEGQDCDWSTGHAFARVSAADAGVQRTLMEDDLKADFRLGNRMHRYHAEISYILGGSADFFGDGDWMAAESEGCSHVPPVIEHACVPTEGCSAVRMLMVFRPSGFDQLLAKLARMTDADFEDSARMKAPEKKFDIINIGPAPSRPQQER